MQPKATTPKKNASQRSITNLIKTDSVENPDQYIENCYNEVEKWKNYWKEKQEEYFEQTFDTNSPAVLEANEIRRFFNQHLQGKLTKIKESSPQEKLQALRFLIPFNAENGITDFILHFFQLEIQGGKPEYVQRDPFEKEVRILYDIYKIKKTMECIDVMRKTVGHPDKEFKSQFSEAEKKENLEQLREVLKVLFRFTIKPEFQKSLFENISMDTISGESIFERRVGNLFYCYPHVIEKYDYRNLFFFIYFREGLSAKVGKADKTFHYNYMNFEILKQEYLTHWLESKLKDNPQKQQIYKTFKVNERTIASWLEEDPSQEMALLKELPVSTFNNLVHEVNDHVEDDLKSDIPSMDETHGEMGEFKKGIKEAAKLARSSLKKLKSFLNRKKEVDETPPEPPEPSKPEADVPAPKADLGSQWQIMALTAKQIPYFYLCQSASKYRSKLAMVRSKLGGEFQNLEKLVTKLMVAFGETGAVRRRTPKHDWTVPYAMKYTEGGHVTDYLFILGGEAKVKAKGMGYSAGDEYNYLPYVIFALGSPDETYGEVEGERRVRNKTFYEYSIANPQARAKVVEFMQMIQNKEFPAG